jgi:hypothetical protein
MAAGKKYRNAGIPIRNITVLMTATMAPAMPPPPDIFDTFICGVGSPFLILRPPTPRYHRLRNHGLVAESLKVPKDKYEAVMRALLNAPPMPMAHIPRKREPQGQAKRP